jgi:hypothetical protein
MLNFWKKLIEIDPDSPTAHAAKEMIEQMKNNKSE